jgi:hypothetical protein
MALFELSELSERYKIVKIATRSDVVSRAIKIASIVGCILAAINHGDRILLQKMYYFDWVKVVLTFCVPYCVSTISSVLAIRKEVRSLSKKI